MYLSAKLEKAQPAITRDQFTQSEIDGCPLRLGPGETLDFVDQFITDIYVGSHTPDYTPS